MKDNLLPKSVPYFFRVSFRLFTMAGKLKDEKHAVSTLNFPAIKIYIKYLTHINKI